MIDIKKPKRKDELASSESQNVNLEFTVMPSVSGKPVSEKEEKSVFALQPKKSKRGFKILLGSAVLLLIVGGVGYLLYSKFFSGNASKPSTPQAPLNVEAPTGEEQKKDSDSDGLTDQQEKDLATNEAKSDTDGDGLSDGDEAHVYGSDPLLPDTDSDGFDDGKEVAGGYSPLIKSSERAISQELSLWSQRIEKFGLHEPTPTTLKLKAASSKTQSKIIYNNVAYKYSLEIPSVLTYREAPGSSSSSVVGIYIAGTIPEGDPQEDPMTVTLAVKIANQTLKDWTLGQYQQDEYQSLQEIEINQIKAVKLTGIKDETCIQDKTFFAKGNTIIILTWTCSQNSAFADLYEQIVQSFKFL